MFKSPITSPWKIVLYCLISLLILYSTYLSSSYVRYQDLGFNTDLARDFLLLADVVNTHKLPLIGPRSGGIPGIFHGPLWIYLNLPAFILGKGNPITVGWFWVSLSFFTSCITFFVGKKLFGTLIGLLSALLVSVLLIRPTPFLFNPFGAVMLFPLFFYAFMRYLQTKRYLFLLFALLLLGCSIQFQIAFGGPILFLATCYLFWFFWKQKLLKHASAFFILLLPFATYILFDVRHQFLELHALIAYAQGKTGHIDNFTFTDFIQNRITGFISSLTIITGAPFWLTVAILFFFVFVIGQAYYSKKMPQRQIYFLFFYFFIGYWLLTLLFRGVVWDYYYWPFMPVVAIILSSGYWVFNKYLYAIFFIALFFFAFTFEQTTVATSAKVGTDTGSWLFNYNLAQTIYAQGDKQFGYYIFSPDEFGYSPRYAMEYMSQQQPTTQALPYKKEAVTYLLISPPGGKDKGISGYWWKIHRVHITSKPFKVWSFSNGFRLEKYHLSPQEQVRPSDPNLIESLIFR